MPHAGPVHVLGIDVGSTNVKTVLVRVDPDVDPDVAPDAGPGARAGGRVTEVAVRVAATPAHPDALVRAVRDLVRDTLAGRPAPLAVGIASMAETGAPLDAAGRPLTDLVRWDGRRGGDDAARLAERRGRAQLFAATGVRTSAKVPLVTWAWLRRTQPDLWRRVARWGGVADLLALALTGRLVTDHTLAGRTMAYRLPDTGAALAEAFDEDLLREVGLTPDQLPRVALPGEPAGVTVAADFVAAGIPAGTPVVVAGHDHAVGTWAAGVRDPGDHADSVGTAEAVVTVLGGTVDRAAVAAQGMSLVRTASGRHEALLAGSPAAGAMVSWWLDVVLPGRGPARVVPTEAPGAPTGLLVLPYPHGRQSPAPDPGARVRVVDDGGVDVSAALLAPVPGDDVPPGARRATVAMLEGLAHQAQWMLDTQRRLAGHTAAGTTRGGPPLVVLAGAAAANTPWMALKAAVCDVPVHLVTAGEPVATGAALLAADRTGLVPSGSLRLPTRVVPRPGGDADAWRDAGHRFVAAALDAGR